MDFSTSFPAEEEVHFSYALQVGTVTVVSHAGPALGLQATRYRQRPSSLCQPELFVLCEAGHFTVLLPRAALSPGPGTGSGAASGGAASGGAPPSGAGSGGAGKAGACGNAPLADVDANFVDIVLRIARAARPLHALAPPQTWCEEQTSVWINALAAFSLRVAPALEVGGELLISVVHDFLALPAAALLPFLERSAEHSPQLKAFLAELAKDGNPLAAPEDSSAAAGRASAATKRLRWGRKGAALRTLLSAGVANEHPCAERIMRDMHPAPSRPVTAPQDLGPGLEATAEGVPIQIFFHFSPGKHRGICFYQGKFMVNGHGF